MNKYIKMFMEDNNLKVGDEFRKKGTDAYDIWHFTEDGRIENERGIGSNKLLVKFMLGEWEVEKAKKEPWKPKLNKLYWFISHYGDVYCNHNADDEQDKYIFTHRPIFPTEQEAADYKWFLDKVDEYKKPFDPERYNYFFNYNPKKEKVYRTWDMVCQHQGTTYFGEKENIREFFEEVGEDRIKKYMFNIWE